MSSVGTGELLVTTRGPIIVTPGPPVITPATDEIIRPTVSAFSRELEDPSEEEEEEDLTTSFSAVAEDSEELEGEVGIKDPETRFEQLKRDGKQEEDDEEESLEDERLSAELSFKERLKARFKKFRQEHKGFLNKKNNEEATSLTKNRSPTHRFNSGSSDDVDSDTGEKRERPKFGKSGRTDLIRKKLAEVLKHTPVVEESTLKRTFVPSFLRTETQTFSSRIRPTNVRNLFNVDASTRSPFSFHRNKGFKRPTIRKNFLNRVLGKNTEEKETDQQEPESSSVSPESDELTTSSIAPATVQASPQPITKSEQPDVSIVTPSPNPPIIPTPPDLGEEKDPQSHEPTLQSSIESLEDVSSIRASSSVIPTPSIQSLQPSERLTVSPSSLGDESTIRVATEELEGKVMEVATIKSAYSFTLGDENLSTRYITVTRSQEVADTGDLSTLHVSTILPDTGSKVLEVATIRSPYSFQVSQSDSVSGSTRYVTVTRTFTSDMVTQRDTLSPSRESVVPDLPYDIIDFNPTPSTTLQEEVVSRYKLSF